MKRRRRLLATGASVFTALGFAGCLDETDGSTETTEVPATSTSRTRDTLDATGTAQATTVHAMDRPDPDHAIWVQNEDDVSHRIAVRVTRLADGDTGEVVYESTHEQPPGGSDLVYNLRESNPDGVERFEVTGTTGGQSASRYVATSECYLDCRLVVGENGSIAVRRPIC